MPLDLRDDTLWLPPALGLITEAGEVAAQLMRRQTFGSGKLQAAFALVDVGLSPTRAALQVGIGRQLGDVERCALRSGNVDSADGWRSVLEPVVAARRVRKRRSKQPGNCAEALELVALPSSRRSSPVVVHRI